MRWFIGLNCPLESRVKGLIYLIWRTRRRRLLSFRAFSYGALFHYTPSPNAPIFFPRIQRKLCQENCTGIFPPSPMTPIFILRLRRSFSLRAFSDSVYFHFPYSPIAPIKKRRRRKKWHLIKIPVIDKDLYFKKLKQNHIELPSKNIWQQKFLA